MGVVQAGATGAGPVSVMLRIGAAPDHAGAIKDLDRLAWVLPELASNPATAGKLLPIITALTEPVRTALALNPPRLKASNDQESGPM